MGLGQAVRLALAAIYANKLRSFLTMLGVIIGVFSVVALVSIGQGATSQVTEQVQGMGSNLVTLNIRGRGAVSSITYDEAMELADRPGVSAVAPVVNGQVTVKYGNTSYDTSLEGTTPDYTSVRNHPVEQGRFLTFTDVENRQKVAVVGTDVVKELFSGTNPLGQEIRINGSAFTVIGVLQQKGGSMGGSNDDKVIIPISTAQRLLRNAGVRTVYIQAQSPEEVDRVVAVLEATMQRRFRDEEAYRVFNQAEMLETVGEVTGTLTLMLGGIAGISLLVGGIGIMNIMLVSVTERTREIGICKALGAKKRDIMLQFLVEAIVISATGGGLGLALGYGLTRLISKFAQLTTVFSPQVIAVAFGFSLLVGVFFGIYPANKAANLSPIEALRAD
ncbi:ABC transporter permease [Zhaonella formicivorans]|uniref:ABC transporter permease n=1 Tax=Zhaonella formicivorans TaxID=2528593 RepID=UPI0010E31EC4|nr:ABC transporter permease [Zhaonella formicivorans]